MRRSSGIVIPGFFIVMLSLLIVPPAQSRGNPFADQTAQHDTVLNAIAGVQQSVDSLPQASGPPCGTFQRFVLSQDQTEVCDNTAGLIWEQTPDSTLDISQPEALTHCPTVGTNYRLPEIEELHSLIDYADGNQATALNTPNGLFSDVQPAAYWSATSWALASNTIWAVDFGFSRSGQVFTDSAGSGNAVWCVR